MKFNLNKTLIVVAMLLVAPSIANAITPVTPTSIEHATDDAWTDVDVTAYLGADAGSVEGIILEIHYNSSSAAEDWGVRENGSADTYNSSYRSYTAYSHSMVSIGIDGSDIFELYLDDASDYNVYIVAYITDVEGEFFSAKIDKTHGTNDTWTDVDISGDTGADTAVMAFFFSWNIDNTGYRKYGLRENGSADNRYYEQSADCESGGSMMSVDGSEILEAYLDDVNDNKLYLQGYVTTNFTSIVNATDFSTATTGSYVEVDFSGSIPAGNNGAFWHFAVAYPSYMGHIRKDSGDPDIYMDFSEHQYGWVEIDSSRKAEQKIENARLDLYLWGYSTDGAAPPPSRRTIIWPQ